MTLFLPTEDQSEIFLKKTKRHAAYVEHIHALKQQPPPPDETTTTSTPALTISSDDSNSAVSMSKKENNSTLDSYDIISSVQSSTNTLSSSEMTAETQQQQESSPSSTDSTNTTTTTTTDFATQDSQDTFSSIIRHIEPIKLIEDHFHNESEGGEQATTNPKSSKTTTTTNMETSFDEGIGSTSSLSTNNLVKNSPIGNEHAASSSILQFPKLSPITYNDREEDADDFLPNRRNSDVDDDDDLEQFDDEADLDVNIDDNENNNLEDDEIDFNDLPTGDMMMHHSDQFLNEQPDDDEAAYGMEENFGGGEVSSSNFVATSMLKDQYKSSRNTNTNKVKFSDFVNEHPSWDDVPLKVAGGGGEYGRDDDMMPPSLLPSAPEFDYANEVDETLPSYAELTEKMSIAASSSNYDGNTKFINESSSSSMYASSRVVTGGSGERASSTDPRFIKSNLINSEFGTRSINF